MTFHRALFVQLALMLLILTAPLANAQRGVQGIDISHHQGTINWNSVANAGKKFAFIKATQGVGFTDSRFNTNIAGATGAGLYAGSYHFASPYTGGVNDAVSEANYFFQVAGHTFGDGFLPPVLDLETQSSLGQTTLSNWAKTFIDRVETLSGTRPIIYTSANYASNFLNAATIQADLWIAHWNVGSPNTGTWPNYQFWQTSATGSVAGISGNVDLDLFLGTNDQLFNLVNATVIPEPALAATALISSLLLITRPRQA